MAEIYAPAVAASATSFELVAPTADEMALRVAKARAHGPWLVWHEGGRVEGFAYASPHSERAAYQWSVNVSVYVAGAARRRGIARALYGALFSLLRVQGYYAAHAGITLPNPASVGLHESLGFRPVGVYRAVGYKLGAWHDVGWWQLPLRERFGEPSPPRPPSAVQPEWEAALGDAAKGLAL
jgi:phosphinothricin acetyltransferase